MFVYILYYRKNETEEQRLARLAAVRKGMEANRKKETKEQHSERLTAMRKRNQAKRNAETPEQHRARLLKSSSNMRQSSKKNR